MIGNRRESQNHWIRVVSVVSCREAVFVCPVFLHGGKLSEVTRLPMASKHLTP